MKALVQELEAQCRKLREELAGVVGNDNMKQAMDDFARGDGRELMEASGHVLDS